MREKLKYLASNFCSFLTNIHLRLLFGFFIRLLIADVLALMTDPPGLTFSFVSLMDGSMAELV